MKIALLPREVQSYIRTGVAITSVSQCVEELVLNSLDAGASCVAVRLDLNCFKVQVVDNGLGISSDQLNILGNRFCTSKCHGLGDLENLTHYGYRGEALASIRDSCSILEVTTRSSHSAHTYCKLFQEGKQMTVTQSTVNRPSKGTTVTVHELFRNFPVRQKSLNKVYELERVREILESIALIRPNISLTLRNDSSGNIIFQTRKCVDTVAVFSQLYSPGKAKMLVTVNGSSGSFAVTGYLGREGHSRKNLQFVYVNDRLVKKTRIHKLVGQTMLSLHTLKPKYKLPSDSPEIAKEHQYVFKSPPKFSDVYPVFIMQIRCPVSVYDITFEPAKTMVEFKDWDSVLACVETLTKQFIKEQNGLIAAAKSEVSMEEENDSQNVDSKTVNESNKEQPAVISAENLTDVLLSKTAKRPNKFDITDTDSDQFKTPLATNGQRPLCKEAFGLGQRNIGAETDTDIDSTQEILSQPEGSMSFELDGKKKYATKCTSNVFNKNAYDENELNKKQIATKEKQKLPDLPVCSLSRFKQSIGKFPSKHSAASIDESLKRLHRIIPQVLKPGTKRFNSSLQRFRRIVETKDAVTENPENKYISLGERTDVHPMQERFWSRIVHSNKSSKKTTLPGKHKILPDEHSTVPEKISNHDVQSTSNTISDEENTPTAARPIMTKPLLSNEQTSFSYIPCYSSDNKLIDQSKGEVEPEYTAVKLNTPKISVASAIEILNMKDKQLNEIDHHNNEFCRSSQSAYELPDQMEGSHGRKRAFEFNLAGEKVAEKVCKISDSDADNCDQDLCNRSTIPICISNCDSKLEDGIQTKIDMYSNNTNDENIMHMEEIACTQSFVPQLTDINETDELDPNNERNVLKTSESYGFSPIKNTDNVEIKSPGNVSTGFSPISESAFIEDQVKRNESESNDVYAFSESHVEHVSEDDNKKAANATEKFANSESENHTCESVSLTQLLHKISDQECDGVGPHDFEISGSLHQIGEKFTFSDIFDKSQASVNSTSDSINDLICDKIDKYMEDEFSQNDVSERTVNELEISTETSLVFSEADWEGGAVSMETATNSNNYAGCDGAENKRINTRNENSYSTGTSGKEHGCVENETKSHQSSNEENVVETNMRKLHSVTGQGLTREEDCSAIETSGSSYSVCCDGNSSRNGDMADENFATSTGGRNEWKWEANEMEAAGSLLKNLEKVMKGSLHVPIPDFSYLRPGESVQNLNTCTFNKASLKNVKVLGQLDNKFIACAYLHGEKGGQLLSYKVPSPRQLTFTENETRNVLAFQEEFTRLGIVVEKESPCTVLVTSVPDCLVQKTATADKIYWNTIKVLILEHIGVSAIKFGDSLTLTECHQLIGDLSHCDLPFQCAHGRPSVVPLLPMDSLNTMPAQPRRKPNLSKLRTRIAPTQD
ncbi:MLH3-like protein [Mya arenaria]|uniref:MLH3-like protein n=1 Tax=Mya arenaria TaxID=6604 RepID=A0ABY7FA70_MYAAR|nr:MLH3-like protein [Mya arenaria]